MKGSGDAPSRPARARRRGRRRRWVLALASVPALLLVAVWLGTRSWFLVVVIALVLEPRLGGDVEIAQARYAGNGVLHLDHLTLRAPGLSGPAAQTLRVGHAVVTLDLSRVLSGRISVRDLELEGVLLRLSEDARKPGTFNLAALKPHWTVSRDGDPLLPPGVRIDDAVLEMGLHISRHYRAVGQRRVAGRMEPAARGPGWYEFTLREVDEQGRDPGPGGVNITGQWNVQTLEHTASLEGLVLDERTFGMCPQVARLWWERMQPQGPVGTAEVRWRPGHPFAATLQVRQISLDVPVAADALFAGGGGSLPRMHVESGTVRLEGDRLELADFVGEFRARSGEGADSMPYRLDLSIRELPSFDWKNQQQWMEKLLDAAPFEMSVTMDDFRPTRARPTGGEVLRLPRQVGDMITRFNLTDWTLSTELTITRATPVPGPDGALEPAPVQTAGVARISDASGAFQGFLYPLDDVQALVYFDNDRVIIDDLRARGSGDAVVRMSGTITPPGRAASISLSLDATDVPLDDRFRAALRGGRLETYDRALHQPSYERILERGLLADESDLEQARRERDALDLVLRATPAASPEAARLRREVERLDTIVEAGRFELGGLVDLRFTIERAAGERRPTEISGRVSIHEAGLVYERFPYPIFVLGGELDVSPDRIEVVCGDDQDGIPIATPGGGRGQVRGEILLADDAVAGARVRPDVSFALHDDVLSELLYEAMPLEHTRPGAPGDAPLAARLLSGAGLAGRLNLIGAITSGPDGAPTFEIAAEVADGTAVPRPDLFEALEELGLPAPQGLRLDSVAALLKITPSAIELQDFAGRQGEARIGASGRFALRSDPVEASLTVDFANLALERYMLDLTPGAAERTAALWDRYRPKGTYDARLRFETAGGARSAPELRVWPRSLAVRIGDREVAIDCERGELSFHPKQVAFEDFMMRVRSGERPEGVVVIDGSYGQGGPERDLALAGSWAGGDLASPIITEALRLMGAERQAERYRRFEPRGTFDAGFEYTSPRGGQPRRYEFTLRPGTLGMTVNGTPIDSVLDPGAELAFTPGRLVVREFSGELEGGRFSVDGAVDMAAGVDVQLDVGYRGAIDSPQLLALLPEPVRSPMRQVGLTATEPVELHDAWVRMIQAEATPGEPRPGWEIGFGGLLETRGAALRVGSVAMSGIDGRFEILADREPGSVPRLEIDARASRARLMGRQITNVEASIELAEDGRVLEVPELRAEAYGGVLAGRAALGLVPGTSYEARLDVAGVSLDGFAAEGATERGEEAGGVGAPGEGPRGETYGSLRVSGVMGRPESRRGRGALRVAWGRMASMPVTLRVLQLFELMPPFSGELDFADVELYVDGDRVVFERLFLECPTLLMIGEGEMSYPGLDLSIRLRTRGTIPLVHDLIAGISNQLFEVEISGPLSDPRARLVPLPSIGPERRPAGDQARTAAAQGG